MSECTREFTAGQMRKGKFDAAYRRVPHSGNDPELHDSLGPLVDLHPSLFAKYVAARAAPAPPFRFLDQSCPDRITMYVAQLFRPLALAPPAKIIEPPLPNMPWRLRP